MKYKRLLIPLGSILLASVAILSGCRSDGGDGDMKAKGVPPPIDLAAPEMYATATFAAG